MSRTPTQSRCPDHISRLGETDNLLRDVAFVLQLTQRVRNSIVQNWTSEIAQNEAIVPNLPAAVPC